MFNCYYYYWYYCYYRLITISVALRLLSKTCITEVFPASILSVWVSAFLIGFRWLQIVLTGFLSDLHARVPRTKKKKHADIYLGGRCETRRSEGRKKRKKKKKISISGSSLSYKAPGCRNILVCKIESTFFPESKQQQGACVKLAHQVEKLRLTWMEG